MINRMLDGELVSNVSATLSLFDVQLTAQDIVITRPGLVHDTINFRFSSIDHNYVRHAIVHHQLIMSSYKPRWLLHKGH